MPGVAADVVTCRCTWARFFRRPTPSAHAKRHRRTGARVKAEELIVLATAHGIDLMQAAGATERQRRPQQKQRRVPGLGVVRVLEPPPEQRAHGVASRTTTRPEWSLAELGQAAHGVPPVPFMAACYAFAGDRSVYWKLWEALLFEAGRLKRANAWPHAIRGSDGRPRFYLSEIAALVLDEDANPHFFLRAPKLYAIYLGIDDQAWTPILFERFDAVKMRYLSWLETARRIIQPRLSEHEDVDGDSSAA